MGIVVSHSFYGMACGDVVEFHEVGNLRVSFDLSSSFQGLSPGGMVSQGFPFSSFSRVSSMFGRVASFLVADEALSVSDVFCPFTRREIDLLYVHSIGIWSRGSASQRDVTVSSSSEFPESYHISVEFPSFVKPLFPLPTSLSVRKGSSSHHDSKLLGYSSLEGVYQDAVVDDSAARLGQFEGGGIFIEVSIEFIHVKGINSLVGSIFEILRNESFFESFA